MTSKLLLFFLIFLTFGTLNAQSLISKPTYLKFEMDSLTKSKILTSLDTLFLQIKRGKIEESLINNDNFELSINTVKSFSTLKKRRQSRLLQKAINKHLPHFN